MILTQFIYLLPPQQKNKVRINDFFRRRERARRKLCSYLLKKSLMENFMSCAASEVHELIWVSFVNVFSTTVSIALIILTLAC